MFGFMEHLKELEGVRDCDIDNIDQYTKSEYKDVRENANKRLLQHRIDNLNIFQKVSI